MVPYCSNPRDYPPDDAAILQAADRIEELSATVIRFERQAVKWRGRYYTARREALEEAARVCEGIRTRIANGPMPEGARFDYEQAIRKLMEEKDE
jgi:hypothetical protein